MNPHIKADFEQHYAHRYGEIACKFDYQANKFDDHLVQMQYQVWCQSKEFYDKQVPSLQKQLALINEDIDSYHNKLHGAMFDSTTTGVWRGLYDDKVRNLQMVIEKLLKQRLELIELKNPTKNP